MNTPSPADTPEVLFVCTHTAGRSQMAAALLDHAAAGRVRVTSAGSQPASRLNPAVVQVMSEIGLDISREYPKSLTSGKVRAADIVISMGCGDACPIYPGKRYLEWDLPDPAGLTAEQIRPIRDEIARRVRSLLAELDAGSRARRHDPGPARVPRMTDHPVDTNPGPAGPAPAGPGSVEIRPATEDDLPQIVEILNYMAANSIANFDTRPVSVDERRDWFGRFSGSGPYRLLVARRGNRVLGYACSGRYRDHEAFRETVEVSIALDAGSRGQGVGTALYRELFDCLAHEPVHVALAGIALPNDASVALHRKFGFTEVGTFREYAIKNGQHSSSIWMQRLCRP